MWLDQKLTWKKHINNLKERCTGSLMILKYLSKKTWGSDRETLLRLYSVLIRSKIDYGSFIYDSTNDTNKAILDKI